jgi:hypothetical protein
LLAEPIDQTESVNVGNTMLNHHDLNRISQGELRCFSKPTEFDQARDVTL